MRALEAPQMVGAFHGGGTLEIGSARAGQGGAAEPQTQPVRVIQT